METGPWPGKGASRKRATAGRDLGMDGGMSGCWGEGSGKQEASGESQKHSKTGNAAFRSLRQH